MTDRARTIVGATGFLILGLAAFLKAGAYQMGGSHIFPRTVAGIMIAVSTLMILRQLVQTGTRTPTESIESRLETVGLRMALTIAGSVLFVLSIPFLGMGTASFLFIVAGCWALGLRRTGPVLAGAAIFAVIVPAAFVRFLHTRLPQELILTILPGF